MSLGRSSAAREIDIPRRRRRPWLVVLGVVVLLLIAEAVVSLVGNSNLQWGVVGEYLFSPRVLEGLGVTVLLTAIAMAIGLVLGTLIALARLSTGRVLNAIAVGYITLFRGIPVLIQIIFWFNLALFTPTLGLLLPGVGTVFGVRTNDVMTPMLASALGLGLNQAAYTSEVVRGGVLSVPREQVNAGLASGLTPLQTIWHVVLPQAIRIIIPPIGNEVIGMLKTTSLVSVVGLMDLLYTVELIFARTLQVLPLLLVAAIWYFVGTLLLTGVQELIERRFSRSVRSRGPGRGAPRPGALTAEVG